MKFNKPLTPRDIWDAIRTVLGVDNSEAMTLANKLAPKINGLCEQALAMDRVELRQELEKELAEKHKAREAEILKKEEAVEKRKSEQGTLTRDELVRVLAEGVIDGDGKLNTAAAKLLTELEGFSAAQQSNTVNIIDFSNAPDCYRTEIPEGV